MANVVPMLAGVGALSMSCICSSLVAGAMGGSGGSGGSGDSGGSGGSPPPPPPPTEPFADWTVEEGIDYPGNDIFHYWPGHATTKASKEVCLTKCKEMSNCKLVTFNNDKTLCWGKSTAANKRAHGDRNNYFKP